jgi:hypothetical protein
MFETTHKGHSIEKLNNIYNQQINKIQEQMAVLKEKLKEH